MTGPSFPIRDSAPGLSRNALFESAQEELRALSSERFAELVALTSGEAPSLSGRVEAQTDAPQPSWLGRPESAAVGAQSPSSSASEDPASRTRRAALERLQLTELARLNAAEQEALVSAESASRAI